MLENNEIIECLLEENIEELIDKIEIAENSMPGNIKYRLKTQVLTLLFSNPELCSTIQPSHLATLLNFLCTYSATKQLFDHLVLDEKETPEPFLKYYVENHSDLETLTKKFTLEKNIYKLSTLVDIYGEEKISEIIEAENLESLESLMNIPSPKYSAMIIKQFTNGFGQVDNLGVLLTCAEIQERKPYLFEPVVCGDINELKELCAFITHLTHGTR